VKTIGLRCKLIIVFSQSLFQCVPGSNTTKFIGNVYSIQNISEKMAKAVRPTDAGTEAVLDDTDKKHQTLPITHPHPPVSPKKPAIIPTPISLLFTVSITNQKNSHVNNKNVHEDTTSSTNTSKPPGKEGQKKVVGMKKKNNL
jgi:hypothetical protein